MPRSMSRRQFLITSGVVSGAALAAGATVSAEQILHTMTTLWDDIEKT